jgi:very-short-patch-repair endonuclease
LRRCTAGEDQCGLKRSPDHFWPFPPPRRYAIKVAKFAAAHRTFTFDYPQPRHLWITQADKRSIYHATGVNPVDVLRYLGGIAVRADLLRHTTRRALEHAVREREVECVGRGRYSLPGLPSALKAGAALGGAVSHASAAAHWLMESIAEPTTIHVTVPSRAHRSPARRITLHYSGSGGGDEVTSPARTVIDCARIMPFRESLAIADSALRRCLVTKEELLEAANQVRGPGVRNIRRVVAHSNGLAANPFESALRAITIQSGLLGFAPQHLISEDGLNWRVDLADEVRRLVAEADSFAFHGTRNALERDCHRYDELISRDWLVLRFSWDHVIFDEPWVSRILTDTDRLRADRRGGSIKSSARNRGRRTH